MDPVHGRPDDHSPLDDTGMLVAVIKFTVNSETGEGTCRFGVSMVADTGTLTDMRLTVAAL